MGEVAGYVVMQCDGGSEMPDGLDAFGAQHTGIDLALAAEDFGPVLLLRDRGVLAFEFSQVGGRAPNEAFEEPTRI